jgi:hypothetical protein
MVVAESPAYDVFISYSSNDGDWVRADLVPQMQAAKLKVNIDYSDFEPGTAIVTNITRAVQNSRRTLLVLSPAWVRSPWTKFEGLMASSPEDGGAVVPLLLEPCELPDHIKKLTYLDFTDVRRRPHGMVRLLKTLGRSQEEISRMGGRLATQGLRALTDLMRLPEVRAAVQGFESTFGQVSQQIDALNAYKDLHDRLQAADGTFSLVEPEWRKFQSGKSTWVDLQDPLLQLESQLQLLLNLFPLRPGSEIGYFNFESDGQLLDRVEYEHISRIEILWVPKIARALQVLSKAREEENSDDLKRPLERVHQVLGETPSKVNDRIVSLVKGLPLDDLVKRLKEIHEEALGLTLNPEASSWLQEFKQGIEALVQIDGELNVREANHNCMQWVSNELRLNSMRSELSAHGIREIWSDVKGLIAELRQDTGDAWVLDIRRKGDALAAELQAADDTALAMPEKLKKLRNVLRNLYAAANTGFNQADIDLRNFCGHLKEIARQVPQILGKVRT